MICKTFSDTVKGTEFERKWDAEKARMINALRSQASRNKKKKAEEEAKKLAAQEQEIDEQYKDIAHQLDDIKKAADAEHSKEEPTTGNRSRKRKTSAEELSLKKKLNNLKKDGNKTGKDKEQLTQEAVASEKEEKEATARITTKRRQLTPRPSEKEQKVIKINNRQK